MLPNALRQTSRNWQTHSRGMISVFLTQRFAAKQTHLTGTGASCLFILQHYKRRSVFIQKSNAINVIYQCVGTVFNSFNSCAVNLVNPTRTHVKTCYMGFYRLKWIIYPRSVCVFPRRLTAAVELTRKRQRYAGNFNPCSTPITMSTTTYLK